MNTTSLISVCVLICVVGVCTDGDFEDDWQWVRYGDVHDDDQDQDPEYDDGDYGPFTMVTENSLVEDDYEDYSDDLDFNIKKEF